MTLQFGQEKKVQNKTESRTLNDFIIDELKLIAYNGKEYDIRNMRVRINIYSDLFNPCLSGNISFMDGLDLPHMYPLIGEEKIFLKFTSPHEHDDPLPPISKMFRVYKMDSRNLLNNKTQVYSLKFISEEYLKANKLKVFRSFKDMPYHEMVEKIYDEYIKVENSDREFNIEKTKYDQRFCFANTTPFEAINNITSRSISDEFPSSAFVFFEDLKGFTFKSLGNLKDQEPFIDMSFGVLDSKESSLGGGNRAGNRPKPNEFEDVSKNKEEYRTAREYFWSKSFDVLENQSYGYYNSKLFTYDPIRQIWDDEIEFDQEKEFEKFKHLAEHPTYTKDLDVKGEPNCNIKLRRTNKDHDTVAHIVEHEPGILPLQLEEYIQQRTYELKSIEENKISMTVPGHPEISPGMVINFFLPEVSADISPEVKQEFDKYFSGKWLIVSVCHRLEQDQYLLDMEISKDSFDETIEHDDIIERYNHMFRGEE